MKIVLMKKKRIGGSLRTLIWRNVCVLIRAITDRLINKLQYRYGKRYITVLLIYIYGLIQLIIYKITLKILLK